MHKKCNPLSWFDSLTKYCAAKFFYLAKFITCHVIWSLWIRIFSLFSLKPCMIQSGLDNYHSSHIHVLTLHFDCQPLHCSVTHKKICFRQLTSSCQFFTSWWDSVETMGLKINVPRPCYYMEDCHPSLFWLDSPAHENPYVALVFEWPFIHLKVWLLYCTTLIAMYCLLVIHNLTKD